MGIKKYNRNYRFRSSGCELWLIKKLLRKLVISEMPVNGFKVRIVMSINLINKRINYLNIKL